MGMSDQAVHPDHHIHFAQVHQDAPATIIGAILRKKELGMFPTPLLFVSSPVGYRRAQKAMTTAHESQMRWFRWGWITMSRYMIINDLKREKTL
jgi:N-acetylglucosaminylphosphatidylinositol deacetylase